jgi:septum site-determining protein MinD
MLNVTDVLEILGIPLIGIIPEDDEVLISTSTGQPTALAEKRTRASAARAFHDIAGRLMGADLAYPDLLRANGTIAGLKRFLGGE